MAAKRPKIAVVTITPIELDGRVQRQVQYLSEDFEVDLISHGTLPDSLTSRARLMPLRSVTSAARRGRKLLFLPAGKVLPRIFYERWYWSETEYRSAHDCLMESRPDAIHANDWESLPAAVEAAEKIGAKVVLDLHEYAPLIRENRAYWRFFFKPSIQYFLRKYVGKIDGSVTVNQTLADKYAREYGMDPVVVMNAPALVEDIEFRPTNPEQISLVHHGIADRDRKLELLIEALALCDTRYRLHFLLVEHKHAGYVDELKKLSELKAPGRVFFHSPVPPAQIPKAICQFDMGMFLLPLGNFNFDNSSPNKFFEFIMAGLAVGVGPSPEMARMTREYGVGIVFDDLEPRRVADALNALKPDEIDALKKQAFESRKTLNAEHEVKKLVSLHQGLLEK